MPKRCNEAAAIQYMRGGLSKKRMPSMVGVTKSWRESISRAIWM
jgi:hypothetical protein